MKRYGRIDANQKKIVEGLRARGALVVSLSAMGKGVPDLLVMFRKRLYLLECKDGNKRPSERALTPDQKKFHALWSEVTSTVTSLEEALSAVGIVGYNS